MTAMVDGSQLQQIVDSLSESVVLVGPDQTITYAKRPPLRFTGDSAQRLRLPS